MDCNQFRTQLLIDPDPRRADLLRHARRCPACERAFGRALEFEARLRRALDLETDVAGDRRDISALLLPGVPSRMNSLVRGVLLISAFAVLAAGLWSIR